MSERQCICHASWSGYDEAEYRARGCPPCECWKVDAYDQLLQHNKELQEMLDRPSVHDEGYQAGLIDAGFDLPAWRTKVAELEKENERLKEGEEFCRSLGMQRWDEIKAELQRLTLLANRAENATTKYTELLRAVGRWIEATARNKKNSDVANYEEFATECLAAWDNVERIYYEAKAALESECVCGEINARHCQVHQESEEKG